MENVTYVLPSARAIRARQLLGEEESLFLPHYITMSEFLSKLCIVEGYRFIDEDTRTLLLLEASNFSNFTQLQIERNFFTFTKNASYIFKFFEELSAELFCIEDLQNADLYAEYEEHISILQELYKRYKVLCDEKKLLDKIFLPDLYRLNKHFLQRHSKIVVDVVGYLTNFELLLLQEACSYCEIELHIDTTRFNTKMQTKLNTLGLELQSNRSYCISLNKKEILQERNFLRDTKIVCESFSESLLQVAFVKYKIYEMIQKGYKAEDIVLILPDENFATLLQGFDKEHNFNFAMGRSFSSTQIYQKLWATLEALDNASKENLQRLKRVGKEYYEQLFGVYKQEFSVSEFFILLQSFKEEINSKEQRSIFEEELFHFRALEHYIEGMSLKALLHLFLQRLAKRSIDDTHGGKITVMGVLETRDVSFDGVVIVDFNEGNVPKKSEKDMFLNTQIRERSKLPTMVDREDLQKHYYELLIANAKEVAISFVSTEQSIPSRFLKQLGIEAQNTYSEKSYAELLFKPTSKKLIKDQEIVAAYDFTEHKISATMLKNFFECRRKFYYRYILLLQEHKIPKDMPQELEIGESVHEALAKLFADQKSFESYEKMYKKLELSLDAVCGKSELEKYQIALYKKQLQEFCHHEVKRFDDGWQVYGCEQSYSSFFAGITISGRIDRIDRHNEQLFVLDYKTGTYPIYNLKNVAEATDFQLEFYYLLAKNIGEEIRCGYYDLKKCTIVEELLLEEKLAVLESNIKDLLMHKEFEFFQCEDLKTCLYCPYKTMCGRE